MTIKITSQKPTSTATFLHNIPQLCTNRETTR
jgi:hypothetical protein